MLSKKSSESGDKTYNARFVVGRHRDKLKRLMVHTSQTTQPSSIRLLLAIAIMQDFEIWISDARQVYLQSSEVLSRSIFIKDIQLKFDFNSKECLQSLKRLYGLSESGDLWHRSFDNHHRKDVIMHPLCFDSALYVSMTEETLGEKTGVYVDNFIRAGTKVFRIKCQKAHKKFGRTGAELSCFCFSGFQVDKFKNELMVHQSSYISVLKPLPTNSNFTSFHSARMKLSLVKHTRPDIQFEVSRLFQVTEEGFTRG